MLKKREGGTTHYTYLHRGVRETVAARIPHRVPFDQRLDLTGDIYHVDRVEMLHVLGEVESFLVAGPEYTFGAEGLNELRQTVTRKIDFAILFTKKLHGLGMPRGKARDLIEAFVRELASSDTETRGRRMSPFDLERLLDEKVKK